MQKCKKQKHRKQKRRKEENIMRKTWKTAGSMLMAVALLTASLSGCGASNEPGETKTSESASAETESASAEAAEENKAEASSVSSDTGEKEDVTVILDYVTNTNHTCMYVALDQG